MVRKKDMKPTPQNSGVRDTLNKLGVPLFAKPPRFVPGAQKQNLNVAEIMQLAAEDCTVLEIASAMGVSAEHINTHYLDEVKRGRDIGNLSIRRKMFQLAVEGNIPLLIWLSKQRLGYRDKQPEEATQIHFHVKVNEIPIIPTEIIQEVKVEAGPGDGRKSICCTETAIGKYLDRQNEEEL